MSEVKRYICDPLADESPMCRSASGDWVAYPDYAKLEVRMASALEWVGYLRKRVGELKAERKMLREALEACDYAIRNPKSNQNFALDAADHALGRNERALFRGGGGDE